MNVRKLNRRCRKLLVTWIYEEFWDSSKLKIFYQRGADWPPKLFFTCRILNLVFLSIYPITPLHLKIIPKFNSNFVTHHDIFKELHKKKIIINSYYVKKTRWVGCRRLKINESSTHSFKNNKKKHDLRRKSRASVLLHGKNSWYPYLTIFIDQIWI